MKKKKINIHKVVKCNVHIKLNRQREIEKHEKAWENIMWYISHLYYFYVGFFVLHMVETMPCFNNGRIFSPTLDN